MCSIVFIQQAMQFKMQCYFHQMVPNDDLEVICVAVVVVMMIILAYLPYIFDWNPRYAFVFDVLVILVGQLQYENVNACWYMIMMNSTVHIYRNNQRTATISNVIFQITLFKTYCVSKTNVIYGL